MAKQRRTGRAFEEPLDRAYRYAAGRPVAFVDESLRLNSRYGTSFYTLTGVLIAPDSLDDVRREILRVGRSPGGRPWHTTSAYEERRYEQIERMVQLVADRTDWSIVTVDAPINGTGHVGEKEARASCLRRLIPELARGDQGARVVIMDHRNEAGDRDDLRIAAELRAKDGGKLRALHLRHGSDALEPLLCAPDVAGWAARRFLTEDETRWIDPARDVTTIVHARSGLQFFVDDLTRTDNSAGQPAGIPAPSSPMTRFRAMRPELLSEPVSQTRQTESTLDRLVRRAQQRPTARVEEPPSVDAPTVDPPHPQR